MQARPGLLLRQLVGILRLHGLASLLTNTAAHDASEQQAGQDATGYDPHRERRISLDGLEMNLHGEDGRVLEHWFHLDALGLLQQLGLIVIPGPRLIPKLVAAPLRKLRRR